MGGPLTPIAAVRRGLRGRQPPPSLHKKIHTVLGHRADATPEVCRDVESIIRTMMSPEEGALDKVELDNQLELVVTKLEVRRVRRPRRRAAAAAAASPSAWRRPS